MTTATRPIAARTLRWLLGRLSRANPRVGHGVAEPDDRELIERRRPALAQWAPFFSDLQALVDQNPGCLHTLCEIGCGDGSALLRAAQTVTGFQWFIGLDPSEQGIQQNREACVDPRFCFLSGEPVDAIDRYAGSGWCFFTRAEVLNAVSWRELDDLLFDIAARFHPAAFAIIESIGTRPERHAGSSRISAVSPGHHYLRLFQSPGWTVTSFKFEDSEPVGNLLLTAITTAFVCPSS